MNKKTIIHIATSTLITTLAITGIAYAATPASNNTTLLNKGTVEVDSLKVGSAGSGGVTFFNGTIVNEGTQTPVTIGDDFRVDGRVWRGTNQGGSLNDNKPFIINDDTEVAGSLTVGGKDIFAEVDTKISKVDAYTKTEIDAKDSAKANAGDVTSNDVDIAANTTAIGNNATSIGNKANTSDVYTKTYLDSALNGKASTSHNHDVAYVSKTSPSWDAQSGFLQIHATEFIPEAVDTNGGAHESSFSSIGLINGTGASKGYFAPVQLPHGSTITKVSMMYHDSVGTDIQLLAVSHPFASDTSANILNGVISHASVVSTGTSADYRIVEDSTITTPLVDNENRFYSLYTILPDSTILGTVRIDYTFTNPY